MVCVGMLFKITAKHTLRGVYKNLHSKFDASNLQHTIEHTFTQAMSIYTSYVRSAVKTVCRTYRSFGLMFLLCCHNGCAEKKTLH